MPKILISGAGGAPSEGVINSLLRGQKTETVMGMGMGSEPSDLVLSQASKKFYMPRHRNTKSAYCICSTRKKLKYFYKSNQ
tara:strand:+ start:209 stop:451 length:243 start_codon:yes stop_codon:yes gene_type:complete